VKLNDIERSSADGKRLSSKKAAKQADFAAAEVYDKLRARRDGKDQEDEEDTPEMMGPQEVEALSLTRVIPVKERTEMQQYGLSKDKFVELFHQYRFQGELFNAIVKMRSDDLKQRSEGVGTSCMGTKYCLCPEDITNLGIAPADLSEESEEFRRFGKLTVEKKIGFMNMEALINAMAKRRDRKLSPEETRQVQPVPTALERLQLQANALDLLKNPIPTEPDKSGREERAWSFELSPPDAAGPVRARSNIYHETTKGGKVGAIAVTDDAGKGVKVTLSPLSEHSTYLDFIRAAERMAPTEATPAEGYNPISAVMHPDETTLRVVSGKVVGLGDGTDRKGHGYVCVVRHEGTGRVRLLVRALLDAKA